MKIRLATSKVKQQLIENTSNYVNALIEENYDYIYEELITSQSLELLATMAWPLIFYKRGNINFLFSTLDSDTETSVTDALSLAFQMDTEECRTGVFRGFAENFIANQWHEFDKINAQVYLDGKYAILAADTPTKPLLMLFTKQKDDLYLVDFEGLWLFSIDLRASIILDIASQALTKGYKEIALEYYGLTGKLGHVYNRIESLMCKHAIVGKYITLARKHEIHEQLLLTKKAQEQYRDLKQEDDFASGYATQVELVQIRKILEDRFSQGELQNLCFDIEVPYENLPGNSKSDKARELTDYMHRRRKIQELVVYIRRNRSDILM